MNIFINGEFELTIFDGGNKELPKEWVNENIKPKLVTREYVLNFNTNTIVDIKTLEPIYRVEFNNTAQTNYHFTE